jgi:hypothetical protein
MKEPIYLDDEQRRNAYQNERNDRWTLEDALLIPIASLIRTTLQKSNEPIRFSLYAKALIDEYKEVHPNDIEIPGYIIGAPDLLIEIGKLKWYVEIKIKRHRYMNTIGGTSTVKKYGCPSHYLDINPVYNNILAHARHFQIPLDSIILLYCVNPNASQNMRTPLNRSEWAFEGINLDDLKNNIDNGRYQRYGQGYGQITWLISCNDLSPIDTIFKG